MTGMPNTIAQIADIQAVAQRLAQHSRGVDRAEAALLADCYHPDATVDYRFYAGPAQAFATILTDAQRGQPVTLHRTAQMWISLDGDTARSESYVMAYVQAPDSDGAMMQRLVCGRYLDRHERREAQWRLSHRTYVLDTNVNWPGSWEASELSPLGAHVPTGGQGSADTGIALLALAAARNRQDGSGNHDMNTQTDTVSTQVIDEVISRQQIADLTMAYCRGVDRADVELLKSIFHDDSTVVSGAFNGNGQEFAVEICRIVEAVFDQTFHSIANQWIDVTGDSAVAETYVIAVATTSGADADKTETLTGGRYIDRFTRREGIWKFAERSFICDWTRTDKSTRQMDSGMYAPLDLQGSQGRTDPIYRFWN